MARWPMLLLRGSTWYYGRTVPLKLRPFLGGRRQLWKSLRTSDHDRAVLLSLQITQEVEREFQALTKRADALADALKVCAEAPDAPERVAREYEQGTLKADAKERRSNPRHEPDELDGLLMAYSAAIKDHAEALDRGDVGIVSKLLDDVLVEYGLHVRPARRHAFVSALLKAHLGVLQTLERREQDEDQGNEAIDYVKGLPKDGRRFPELKAGPHDGKPTGAFSKRWARFTDGLGVSDPRKTFHSLRQCFKDACRSAGLSEEVHDALTEHVSGAVGRTYGRGVPLEVLKDAVERITFPAVEPRRRQEQP